MTDYVHAPTVDGVRLEFLIPIVFGDWSGDGHSDSSREYVWSNRVVPEWKMALIKGQKSVGVDLKDICGGYGERTIEDGVVEILRSHGFEHKFNCDKYEGDPQEMTPHDFKVIFLFLVGKGDPDLRYMQIKHGTHSQEIHPGGYGLYGD